MPAKTQRKKRGRYSFLLTFFVVLALIFAFFLTSGLFFKIKEIEVEGNRVYTSQEVAGLTGFSYGDNIFLINKMSAVRAIITNLPYAKAVRIRRDLPGKVVIIITEAAPCAVIEHRGSYWLFDTQGTLLESVAVPAAPKLPTVKGMALLDPLPGTRAIFIEEDEQKFEPLLEILRTMQEADIWEDVSNIDISRLSNVVFTYKNIYKVELGTPDMLEKKLQFLTLSIDQLNGKGSGTLLLAPVGEDKPAHFIPDNE